MVNKKLIAQLLLICFSVILGHQWIPHHHHAEVLTSGFLPSCPVHHQDQHSPGEHPFHCHAFNDLALFKEDPSDALNDIHEVDPSDAIPAIDGIMGRLPVTGLIRVPLAISVPSLNHQGTVPTRGPPSLT